jgi:hypothetical protein
MDDPFPTRKEDLDVEVNLNTMDQHTRFEHSFPFYRMNVVDFEGKVKRYVMGKSSVSLS